MIRPSCPLQTVKLFVEHAQLQQFIVSGASVEQRSCTAWLNLSPGSSASQVAELAGDFDLAKVSFRIQISRRLVNLQQRLMSFNRYSWGSALPCRLFSHLTP